MSMSLIPSQDAPVHNPSPAMSLARDRCVHEDYIAIIGVTGVGKSTFIELATGQHVPVSHGLNSCECSGPWKQHFLDFQVN